MTVAETLLTGASSTSEKWDSINWKNTEAEVYRLQIRIAKAVGIPANVNTDSCRS
jgi:hypothetical protein